MALKALPPQDVLRQLLDYDPEAGVLTWKERDAAWFPSQHRANLWNSRYAGKPALTHVDRAGYHLGAILGANYRAHRVAWKMVHGTDPAFIDHVNGIRTDNRLDNLRSVTRTENNRNACRRKDNTSGMTGIRRWKRHAGSICWIARSGNDYLGIFDCLGEAIRARRAADRDRDFSPRHGAH